MESHDDHNGPHDNGGQHGDHGDQHGAVEGAMAPADEDMESHDDHNGPNDHGEQHGGDQHGGDQHGAVEGAMAPADDLSILLSLLLLVTATAPLGCFIVWRRMAYFADALVHCLLPAAALALTFHLNVTVALLATAVLVAALLGLFKRQSGLHVDTLLGVVAHGGLALGLLFVLDAEGHGHSYEELIFGSAADIDSHSLLMVAATCLFALFGCWRLWKPFLTATVSEEIAVSAAVGRSKTVSFGPQRAELAFTLLLAVTVAAAVQMVGILLVAGLLIIPAATAGRLCSSPSQMAFFAAIVGLVAVLLGFYGAEASGLALAPAVIAAAFCLFLVTLFFRVRL